MAKPDGRIEKGQKLGSAISARRWNDLCDAADIAHGRRPGVTAGQVQGPAATCLTVVVKNNSSADIPMGGWLSLRYREIDGVYNFVGNEIVINEPGRTELVEPVFIGNSYVASAASASGQFAANGLGEYEIAVAVEPIKQGSFGRCAFQGIVPARLAVTGPYGDPLTDEGLVTNPPGGAGNNFFPGPWYGEVPWHAVPVQGQTSCLVPVNNNQPGARPIRILWIENSIATGPTGVSGPAYRNGLVQIHGADSSFVKHVLYANPSLPHANSGRASQSSSVESALATGVACDYTGIPIVRYSYSATGVSTGPEVVEFVNVLRPHTQIRPSGVYLTVAQSRQHPSRVGGALGYARYWAISSDHPTARQFYYDHAANGDWGPYESKPVTFFGVGLGGGSESIQGTVTSLSDSDTIVGSFYGMAVADARGVWNLCSYPVVKTQAYKSLSDRLDALEIA